MALRKKITLLVCSLFATSSLVCGETISFSDSVELGDAVVTGKKYEAHKPINLLAVNTQQAKFQNLGDILQQSGISLRSNGAGQLTLASVRGLYGNQMNLLWEGVNIQSPMNGSFDLSLIPVFMLDQASLVQNNHSSISGNAALSGSIAFQSNQPVFGQKKYALHSSLGSFGKVFTGADAVFSSEKFFSRTRVFRTQATYDYPILGYENTPFRQRQVNNDFLSMGLLQEFAFNIRDKSLLSIKTWLQKTDRGLSDAIAVPNPQSRQEDAIKRFYLDWKFGRHLNHYAKAVFFDEQIVFTDNQLVPHNNRAQTYIAEVGSRVKAGEQTAVDFGFNQTLNRGLVDAYGKERFQNLFSAFVSLEKKGKRITLITSLRQQLHNRQLLLPAPSFGLYSYLNRKLKVRFNTGYSYRVPTFNDMYWTPGGNPDLLNESAFKNELGADYSGKRGRLSVSMYHNEVENLIVWQETGAFWEPQNIRGARVLGAELRAKYAVRQTKTYTLNVGLFGSLNHSVYSKAEAGNEDIVGNQLIFIPLEMGNVYLHFKNNRLDINLIGNYTGSRYISTDNSSELKAYMLTDFTANYQLQDRNKKVKGVLGIALNNLFNVHYELFPRRPLPGLNMQINLSIYIN